MIVKLSIFNPCKVFARLPNTFSNRVRRGLQSLANSDGISDTELSPRILSLSNSICELNLFETAQLVRLLKKRLNLPDVIPTAASQPTIVQQGGGGEAATSLPATPAEKSEYRISLDKIDATNKAKVIKEIKSILPQLNLVEAKNFVESIPKLIKEKVKKEEAEKIKKALEDLGATVVLE